MEHPDYPDRKVFVERAIAEFQSTIVLPCGLEVTAFETALRNGSAFTEDDVWAIQS